MAKLLSLQNSFCDCNLSQSEKRYNFVSQSEKVNMKFSLRDYILNSMHVCARLTKPS